VFVAADAGPHELNGTRITTSNAQAGRQGRIDSTRRCRRRAADSRQLRGYNSGGSQADSGRFDV